MKFSEIVKSRYFATALMVFGILALLLMAFGVGVSVGYHKAVFSHHFGDNYERNFGRSGPRNIFGNPGVPGHGATGKIVDISSSSLIVADLHEGEASILVEDGTQIRRFNENLRLKDLKIGDFVLVIGSPDDEGRIRARYIRVLPSPRLDNSSSNRP